MIADIYNYELGADYLQYEFDSSGPKGIIRKVVQYSETNLKNVYNLGFGDKDLITNELNDLIITNNGDSQKVLATVASTLFVFTDNYPDATVIAIGATSARTRLYRMGITNNIEEIEKDFEVYGLKNKTWFKFSKNITYDAFLVKRKK